MTSVTNYSFSSNIFLQQNYFEIRPCCGMHQQFILFLFKNFQAAFQCIDQFVYLFILLMNIWVICNFGVLQLRFYEHLGILLCMDIGLFSLTESYRNEVDVMISICIVYVLLFNNYQTVLLVNNFICLFLAFKFIKMR